MALDGIVVSLLEFGKRCPLLAFSADVLALVLTDWAV
jgi:hypothetical protein